jgi:hypothetical protein
VAAVHILPTIGRVTMRAAGGAAPATTAASAAPLRHISRGCDQDYDDDDDNAGHTTFLGQRNRVSAPLLPPPLPLLSFGGTVPLICAHP